MAAASLRISEPSYYHREYTHDIPINEEESQEKSWTYQCKRVATVALPYVSLYQPLSFPLSLAMGGFRVVSSSCQWMESSQEGGAATITWAVLQTAVAVASLAGTIFAHPLGMLITTGNDLVIEVAQLLLHLREGDLKKAGESCLNIINNTLYLTLFLQGGVELTIASLAMQILVGVYHSQDEFSKGNYLEAAGHIGMAVIRGNQLDEQVKMLSLKWEIESLKKFLSQKNESNVKESHQLAPENARQQFRKANSAISSEHILEIYRKCRGAADLKTIITRGGIDLSDVHLLLKHHMYRPDENGVCCRLLVERGAPLELIQICLPDREFLSENPKYIDDLLAIALANWNTKENIICFLSNRESVKSCAIRDAYFMDWYHYELRLAGSRNEEGLHDFVRRTGLTSQEITHLLSKLPLEVKRLCGYPLRLSLPLEELNHHWLSSDNRAMKTYEYALMALKYNISKPAYYGRVIERTGAEVGFAGQLIANMGNILSLGERGEYLLMELLQRTFPGQEYRNQRNKEEEIAFLNFFAFHAAHCGQYKPDQAIRVFRFLSQSGVDLNEVAANTRHVHVRKFLHDRGLVD